MNKKPWHTSYSCVVCGKSDNEVERLHCFPRNNGKLQQWLDILGKPELLQFHNLRHRRICSSHFDKSQYRNDQTYSLNRNAVPRNCSGEGHHSLPPQANTLEKLGENPKVLHFVNAQSEQYTVEEVNFNKTVDQCITRVKVYVNEAKLMPIHERKHNDNSKVCNLLQKASGSQCDNMFDASEVTVSSAIDPPIADILFIEPFYSGSHKQLIDLLHRNFPSSKLITLSGKKWPWRARCSALILSEKIPAVTTETTLFSSSVVSLAELLGLRVDLQKLWKIVYFHENQFIYPIREIKERDVQFAYNQITTCLAADEVLFNTAYNLQSFVENFDKIMKILPDYRPTGLLERIRPKCKVLYFPIEYPRLGVKCGRKLGRLQIAWPHRWEFDKCPEIFIGIMQQLKTEGCDFTVHLLGGNYTDFPDVIQEAGESLADHLGAFGFVDSKEEYYQLLRDSDVVVSTAIHEFFGVSMLEATYCGCFPIVPNRLVYPEIYPVNCRYNTDMECLNMLIDYCKFPEKAFTDRQALNIDFGKYSLEELLPEYKSILKNKY